MTYLLVVNALLALGFREHEFHERVADWVAGLDLNAISFVIVGIFAVTWLVALLVWRVGRIEQRWTAQPNGLERLV